MGVILTRALINNLHQDQQETLPVILSVGCYVFVFVRKWLKRRLKRTKSLKIKSEVITSFSWLRCFIFRLFLLVTLTLALAVRDCNPGILFQSRDFGIEKCQYRDWVRDFELVKISSNSLVLVSWWVLESWSICWSPVLTYYYVNNCKYFTFLVSCRMIQFHHYLM